MEEEGRTCGAALNRRSGCRPASEENEARKRWNSERARKGQAKVTGKRDHDKKRYLRSLFANVVILAAGMAALACAGPSAAATPWPEKPTTVAAQEERGLATLPKPTGTSTPGTGDIMTAQVQVETTRYPTPGTANSPEVGATVTPDIPATAAAQEGKQLATLPTPTAISTPDTGDTMTAEARAETTKSPTPQAANTPEIEAAVTPDNPATVIPQEEKELTTRPAPTATSIPGRPELYLPADTPEHMAYVIWLWEDATDDAGQGVTGFKELVIEFTIHNNVALGGDQGLYLMLAHGSINGEDYYFGLQTDVYSPEPPTWRGKGLIFSRWGTRDLANARYSDKDGWTQSSGHEGDFIGIRRSYEWGAGDYRVTLAPDGEPDEDGVWMGLWITNVQTDVTTWVGSLKFPANDGHAIINPESYSTIEIYGRRIKPIEIPQWHVSIRRPEGDGIKATGGLTGYSPFYGQITNSEANYNHETQEIHLKVGGETARETRAERISREDAGTGSG